MVFNRLKINSAARAGISVMGVHVIHSPKEMLITVLRRENNSVLKRNRNVAITRTAICSGMTRTGLRNSSSLLIRVVTKPTKGLKKNSASFLEQSLTKRKTRRILKINERCCIIMISDSNKRRSGYGYTAFFSRLIFS